MCMHWMTPEKPCPVLSAPLFSVIVVKQVYFSVFGWHLVDCVCIGNDLVNLYNKGHILVLWNSR
jgi:hypothetical protein